MDMLLRAVFEAGRSIEFVPKRVEPLGIRELWATVDGNNPSYGLHFATDAPIIDGEKQEGHASVSATINFDEQPFPFALVQGGWLPLPFVIPPRFLVDRNVVAAFRKLRNGASRSDLQAIQWWTCFFNDGTAMFNPLTMKPPVARVASKVRRLVRAL
jgi:hypothetical protein